MKHQRVMFGGIVLWLFGCIFDSQLIRFSYILIIVGTIISYIGAIDWLRSKDNRKRLRETFSLKTDLPEMIRHAFDFSWRRVSVLWTTCALFGMLIVHLGAIVMKSTGAYEYATREIIKDKEIIEQVGEVKDFSYMITGHATSGNGFSELNIGVIGTKSSANVRAEIEGINGSYLLSKLRIKN